MSTIDARRALKRARLAREQQTSDTTQRIQSPIAKYDAQGRLHCALCRVPIKSEHLWQAHIASRSHQATIERLKQLKNTTTTIHREKETLKRKADQVEETEENVLPAENTDAPSTTEDTSVLPTGFFDREEDEDRARKEFQKETTVTDGKKDQLDEEWEKFQKEIQEVSANTVQEEKVEVPLDEEDVVDELDAEVFMRHRWEEEEEEEQDWRTRLARLRERVATQISQQKTEIDQVETTSSDTSDESDVDPLAWVDWRAQQLGD
jgi:zinc finger protein 830